MSCWCWCWCSSCLCGFWSSLILNPAPIFCLDDATLIRRRWFGTRWLGPIWIAVLLVALHGAEASENGIQSERRLQVVEETHVQGWAVHSAVCSAGLIVWLITLVIAYKLGHQHAVKQGLVSRATVQTDEVSTDDDRELVDILNKKYTVDILRKAAQQHGCCPGYGARKLNVIETLVRHRKVTRVNHGQVMSAAARSVH
jgi:hypothetical protein